MKGGGKVKKGFLAVQVGLEDDAKLGEELQKFVIPIWYLRHPQFVGLLDLAGEVYGYHADGPLRLPCSVDDFIHLRWQIDREHGGGHHNHHHLHGRL